MSDTESRRGALEAELSQIGYRVGMPTAEHQAARAARMAQIQTELDALPKPPAQATGMEAGIIQFGEFLGSPWRPPEREPDPVLEADPYLRYMRELGQDWTT